MSIYNNIYTIGFTLYQGFPVAELVEPVNTPMIVVESVEGC